MIIRIWSSIETFREISFDNGLNIVLAERDLSSGEAETRNGSGKSSLIEIIHFLLGSTPGKGSLFNVQELSNAIFYADMRVDGIDLTVERSVRNKGRVIVDFPDGLSHGLDFDYELVSRPQVAISEWCAWLGRRMFKLPQDADPRPSSFRQLIGYFARRREDGGFMHPHRYSTNQSEGEAQVALSYLLGLDWKLALEFQGQREEKRDIANQRKRAKARAGRDRLQSVATLRSAVALARVRADTLRARVANFVVHDQYQDLAAEASAAKIQLERLSRESVSVRSAITHTEGSLIAEQLADGRDVHALYKAAGIELPEIALRTFEQVREFHKSVVSNRRHHLDGQLRQQQARLGEINTAMGGLSTRRSEILSNLAGKGAFSDLADTNRQLALKEAELASLERQLADAQVIEQDNTSMRDNENRLLARLQADLEARTDAVSNAVLAVEEARSALYGTDRPGLLEINAKANGPEFQIRIDGTRSGGISNMEIFCFDYALSKITKDLHGGPRFLVHDSHLFDGVDSRQAATAIEQGALLADYIDGQYIVLMNSDEFAGLRFEDGFDAAARIRPTVLNDTETGGLFGFRFA